MKTFVVRYIGVLLITCLILSQVGCGTWEVKFGMSEHNGSTETRTYRASEDKK